MKIKKINSQLTDTGRCFSIFNSQFLILLFLLQSISVFGQRRLDEECIRAVADNILKQPVTQFTGVTTDKIYNSTSEIPAGEDVKFRSPLMEWHYSNGVLDMSMIRLGKYLNEPGYIEYAKNHIAFGFANYKYFKNTFRNDRNHWLWPFGQLWNTKELDDCGAMGAAVINVYELDAKKEYRDYIETAANHIMNNQTRLSDGTLCRTFPRKMTVWADDAYMGVSFLSQMGRMTKDVKYFDEAARQIINITNYLWCPEKQLFFHCYYTDLKRNGVAFWGRANGWIMVSTVMLLDVMPENHPKRGELISILEKQIVGASRYQNANGLWNQLLDKPDSYDESSVTAMYTYCIAKAVNNKWIDASYARIAEAAWKALKETQITPEGHFKNVCVGTGISDDLPFYFNRPVGENEKHGLGLIIDTGIEMMKLAKNSDLGWVKEVGARTFPAGSQTYNVADYGGVADGKTLNTAAIQQVIDNCASNGGGTVTFSPGHYLTGSIYLKEGVHLHIPEGVTLLGSTDLKDYPEINTRIAGIEMVWPSALINVLNQKNVILNGEGTIHAQGKIFWDSYWAMRKEYDAKGLRWIVDYDCKRPRTILVSESSDVTIKGLTVRQAGFWTVQILYSSYCTVDGVVIQNNLDGHGPSTDGIDIDSSSRILVENCDIDCNDDNFCLKAGRDADGLRVNRPTEYIVIRNCISRAGSGLLTCGSETSGGIRYVLADGMKAKGTTVGIRLKSAMTRGGVTEHIYVQNVEMDEVGTVFEATTNWNPSYSYSTLPEEYKGKKLPEHWQKMLEEVSDSKGTPYFKDIYLSNFKVGKAKYFVNVTGSEQSLMKNFFFNNITSEVGNIGKIDYAENWNFSNVLIKAQESNSLKITNSQRIKFPL